MNVLRRGPRTFPNGSSFLLVRMWNDGGRPRSTTASQNSSYIGIVVVALRRHAGQHHAAQPERLDRLEIGDALGRRAQRGLAHADEAIGRRRAELGDPMVVRVEARVLVVDVGVVAEQHAHRRIDHLGRDAVEILVGEAGDRVPAAAPEILEALAGVEADLFGRAAGRGDQPERHEALAPVDQHHVAEGLVVVHAGRPIPELRIDAVDVGAGRFGDVRVRRDARAERRARCVDRHRASLAMVP